MQVANSPDDAGHAMYSHHCSRSFPHRRACVAVNDTARSTACFAVEAPDMIDHDECNLQRAFKAASFIKSKLAYTRLRKAEHTFAESEMQNAETLIIGTAAQRKTTDRTQHGGDATMKLSRIAILSALILAVTSSAYAIQTFRLALPHLQY